jgi:uncharacterized protein with HEPN domain
MISEASRRLPDELKGRHASIAWNEMAAAGNIYRHEYEDVAAKLVSDTVALALPPLREAVAAELALAARQAWPYFT